LSNLAKVLKKIGISIDKKEIENIINCQSKAIENFLKLLYSKVSKYTPKNREQDKEIITKEISNTRTKMNESSVKNDKEDNYKMLIMSKDKTILELKSTLEVLFCKSRFWN
jgi:hypothetical protein